MLNVALQEKFKEFLKEDIGMGDITTETIVPADTKVRAQIVVKESAVISGFTEIKAFFDMLNIRFISMVEDGDEVPPGTVIAEISGDGFKILSSERTILNLLMRMSGISTITRKLVSKVRKAGFHTRISATRKTVPGLRYFDKRAVIVGGGDPHRFRLDDVFLIKDNHIAIAGGVEEAMKKVILKASFSKKIEVESKKIQEAVKAAELGADIVMIDNMMVQEVKEVMDTLTARDLRKNVLVEISGGINEKNLLDYARLKPDVISLGSLTHSVKAVDMSLEVVEVMLDI